MGSSASKPASAQSSQYVFTSESPIRFSPQMINSLQASPESDSTREKELEKVIQSRVTDELRRLEEQEAHRLRDVEQQIKSSASVQAAKAAAAASAPRGFPETKPIPLDGSSSADGASSSSGGDLTSPALKEEIGALRARLDGRKKVRELDPAVRKARDAVVECLRVNDRRPLDCWNEVAAFKKEVARLEEDFVDRAL